MAIKISRYRLDMDTKPIINCGSITATELHGVVYYSDVHFEEKECAICGKRFKPGDGVCLFVRRVTRKGTDFVPAHIACFGASDKRQRKTRSKPKKATKK
jgi:hypothetical protein